MKFLLIGLMVGAVTLTPAAQAQRLNSAVVVWTSPRCDWFVASSPSGFYLMQWFGGHLPIDTDTIRGNINSFGMKDVRYNRGGVAGRVWVDDFFLSSSSTTRKLALKCPRA